MPREGATELTLPGSSSAATCCWPWQEAGQAGGAAARGGVTSHVRDDRELVGGLGLSLSVRAGEDRRARGGRRQRPAASWSMPSPGSGCPSRGVVAIEGRDIAGQGRAGGDRGRCGSHRRGQGDLRGLVLPFTLSENVALREYRRPCVQRARVAPARSTGRNGPQAAAEESSMCAAAARTPTPQRCRAEISRRCASPARSPRTRSCWSPTSRLGDLTSGRSSSFMVG